jgi:hypothetical protein
MWMLATSIALTITTALAMDAAYISIYIRLLNECQRSVPIRLASAMPRPRGRGRS